MADPYAFEVFRNPVDELITKTANSSSMSPRSGALRGAGSIMGAVRLAETNFPFSGLRNANFICALSIVVFLNGPWERANTYAKASSSRNRY